jgi:predicted MFS family arabinose efflux permease
MFILNTAGITGSLIGGFISQHLGYPRMFMTGSCMALTAFIILAVFVRNPAPDDSESTLPG